MNRVLNLAAVVLVSSFGFATVSHAESLDMNAPGPLENTLRTFSSDFDVHVLGNWDQSPEHTTRGSSVSDRSAYAIQGIQAAIEANGPLVARLERDGVKVSNIVDAEQAADGGMTFYSR